MIPTRRFIALVLLLAAVGLAQIWLPDIRLPWLGVFSLLLVMAALDAFVGRKLTVKVRRELPASMSLDRWLDVTLRIDSSDNSKRLILQVFDHVPETFVVEGMPANLHLDAQERVDLLYRVRAIERGRAAFGSCELRVQSSLGLWWRTQVAAAAADVRVYPNYTTVSKQLAYQVDSNLQLAGLRLRQRRGEGTEFHQLRDYREGDALRSVDWKATARVGRLIAREYQDERDQQIIVLLDTGRRMLAKDHELSHFDHSLNAMLLLSFVALRQGDAAGVMAMGGDRRFLAPRKGAAAINGILNHVYDIQPTREETDFVAAATNLVVQHRRRSLVVMLTNVREEDTDELRAAATLLGQKHLVMVASLRERALDDSLEKPVRNYKDALTFAATNQYVDSRDNAHKLLQAAGIYVEDCLCDELPAAITNRYLAIKRAGVL